MNYINKLYIVKEYVVLLAIGASFIFPNYAQQLSVSAETKSQITQIVSYLEYSLNVMGDAEMEIADKEVISNESYLRIFSYPNVQIEDDLSEHRSQPIYKNVQAYLRDISFFFQKAQFELKIISIEKKLNTENQPYYLVSAQQKINAITKSNQKFSSSKTRFIELNPSGQIDLKIVSIYSTKLLQVDDNIQWWEKLSLNWKKEFAKYIYLNEDVTLSQLMEMKSIFNWKESYEWIDQKGRKQQIKFTKENWSDKIQALFRIKSLNLSGENFFTNIHPLSRFAELESVNLENTQVKDIDGLRNAIYLKELNLSNTSIDHLEPIIRLANLEKLNVAHSRLLSLSGIENLTKLVSLDLSNTLISPKEIQKVGNVPSLESLYLRQLKLEQMEFIKQLPLLKNLDLSKTNITDLKFLASSSNLERLWIENTPITSLNELRSLENLQYIFCDGSGITQTEVHSFLSYQPKCIVVYESSVLTNWWQSVPNTVKEKFTAQIGNIQEPTKQELHQLIRAKKLDIAHEDLYDISWIKFFTNLEEFNAEGNPIKNIEALLQLKSLRKINLSQTAVKEVSVLSKLEELEEIYLRGTEVFTLIPFRNLPLLKILDVNNTGISMFDGMQFENQYPSVLILYKSEHLKTWWKELPAPWQTIFENHYLMEMPNELQLHQMVKSTRFSVVKDTRVTSIAPLKEFRNLQELRVSETNITDIQVLYYLNLLTSLDISRNPIQDFSIIGKLFLLENLDVSSVRLKDISFLSNNTRLRNLSISNTQVKSLKAISKHSNLEVLDISNTSVNNISSLKNLPLKKLICYNTKLKPKQIQLFKQQHPHCEVVYY